jgi:hypothetical protein
VVDHQVTGAGGRPGAAFPPSGLTLDDNGGVIVPAPPSRRAVVAIVTRCLALAACLILAACGGSPPDLGGDVPSPPVTPTDPQGQLAGLAAAAKDHRYVAAYTLTRKGRPDRAILAALAADGTWEVNVPGGALGGGADVSIVGTGAGIYQCLLGGPATVPVAQTAPPPPPSPSASPGAPPSASPSPTGPQPPTYRAPACVRIAAAGKPVPRRYDPVIEHPFTDWPGVLLDRNAPIAVSAARPLPGATGACYSVEPNAASLAPSIDPGIFCYTPDGTLTAAALDIGSLTMVNSPAPAPPTVALPAPVVPGPAAPVG